MGKMGREGEGGKPSAQADYLVFQDILPAQSMKTKSTRICAKDGCLLNVCKSSGKVCSNKCSLGLESHEKSKPDFTESNQNGFGIMDIVNEKINCNEVAYSVMRYCGDDFVVRDGLFPADGAPHGVTDTLSAEDLGKVTIAAQECKAVGCDETVREDAFEKARIDDHNSAANHCFLNESSYLDQLTLGFEDNGAFNLHMAELDYILRSSLQGFGAELVLPSDMRDDCLMLPFLEETMDTSFDQVKGFCGEFWTSLDNNLQLHVMNSHSNACNPAPVDVGYMDIDEMESVDPVSFIRNFLNLSDLEANSLPALLPKETSRKRVTLVLDLDETLVHSTLKPCADADFSFKILVNTEEQTVSVRQRPFLKVFLERVTEMFEVILFTASQRSYAKLLLDNLDPEGKFFSRCAFRESCVLADGIFTKDLTVLGVDLAKIAIVDNTPQVYRWQVNNGIPIKSWYDDPSDCELMSLLPFLETLVDVDDVRPIIAQKFGGKGQ